MEKAVVEYHHNRTKAVSFIQVEAIKPDDVRKLCRFIEIQLNKHGWYRLTRIKVRGHYRSVARDEKGRFKKVKKWTSKTHQRRKQEAK